MSDIGFGVIGLGMGKHHCMAIDKAPGARLAGVCDVDEERLSPVAEQYGCRAHTDYSTLLEDDDIQVVNIATPSGSHAAIGAAAAAAGKHLIVEKPVDITPARIELLIGAVQRSGVKAARFGRYGCARGSSPARRNVRGRPGLQHIGDCLLRGGRSDRSGQ